MKTLRRNVRGALVVPLFLATLATVGLGLYELRHWIVTEIVLPMEAGIASPQSPATSVPTGTSAIGTITEPDFRTLAPFGYAVTRSVPLAMAGPTCDYALVSFDALNSDGAKGMNVRFVCWDSAARAWKVALDLHKQLMLASSHESVAVMPEGAQLLSLDVVHFTGQTCPAVVVCASAPGAIAMTHLAVVSHETGVWRLAYSFASDAALEILVWGAAPKQTLRVATHSSGSAGTRSSFAVTDRFVVGGTPAGIAVIDDLPR